MDPQIGAGRVGEAERRRAAVAVAVATVAAFALRVWLAASVSAPFMFHDEGGYSAVARVLVGDAPELFGPPYAPAYGILLAPFAAVLEPAGLHTAGQWINAAAAAAMIPALHAFGRRAVGLRPWMSAAVATVGGMTAASIVQSTMLLAESLFALTTIVVLLLVHRFLERPGVGSALAAGSLAGLSYAVHPRGVVLLIAAVLLAGAVRWRRHVGTPGALALGGAAVVVGALSHLATSWFNQRIYRFPSSRSAGDVTALVEEPVAVAQAAIGQLWYIVFASVGLCAFGAVAVAMRARQDHRRPDGIMCWFIAVGFLGSVALGATFFHQVGLGPVDRADKPVYGRYLEQWLPVLILYAPVLARRLWGPVLAGAASFTALAGVFLRFAHEGDTWQRPVAWHNIASLRPVSDLFGELYVVRSAFALAVVLAAVFGALVWRKDERLWALPLLGALVWNVAGGIQLTTDWARPASEAWAARHELGPVIEDLDEPVAIDAFDPQTILYAYNLQFWHPDIDIELTSGAAGSDAGLRIAPVDRPPVGDDPEIVAHEPATDLALWVIDRELRMQLRRAGFLAGTAAG